MLEYDGPVDPWFTEIGSFSLLCKNIVEKTLDNTGKILGTKTVGKLLDLPVIKETTNAAGQTVKQVKDATGQVIEVVVDNTGKIIKTTKIGTASKTN